MAGSLFGKLPAKRDFVSFNVTRAFLDVWEPWMQRGVATSRQALGEAWTEAFRNAPIWRFWLGAGFCGTPVLGAFMPSVDAVGRYFPLTVYAVEEAGMVLAPPEIDAHEPWLEAVETVMLDALHPDATYETVIDALGRLPSAPQIEEVETIAGLARLPDGGVLVRDFGPGLPASLRAARRLDHRASFARQCFWWTIGGEGYPQTALAGSQLPPPARFRDMLTGHFADVLES